MLRMCLHGHSRIPIHIALIIRVLRVQYIRVAKRNERGLRSTSVATWALWVAWEEDQGSGCCVHEVLAADLADLWGGLGRKTMKVTVEFHSTQLSSNGIGY